MTKGYEFFDHTADVGLKCSGKDLKELFINGAKGMFEVLGDVSAFSAQDTRSIDIESADIEELFHDWLSELLFIFDSEKIFLVDFRITELNGKRLRAVVRGESYNQKASKIKGEIKAVTYHGMEVVKDKNGYSASVVFDI